MSRSIHVDQITEAVREMCMEANYDLADDMKDALNQAAGREESPLGCRILNQLQENLSIASTERIPICQDTGMAVIFCEIGQDLHIEGGYTYEMSILKSNNGDPDQCLRFAFSYDNPFAGEGHFIHTYMGDGNPLPSYEGEPTPVTIPTDDLDEFTDIVWKAINEDNKVSLFTRFIDIETGKYETRIVNKNK